jgi:hypothetical protein
MSDPFSTVLSGFFTTYLPGSYLFAMEPDSRINSWVYFQPAKNKHQSILRIRFPECKKSNTIREYMKIQDGKCIIITKHT